MNPPIRLSFVCAGPQRTATTWLDRALRIHPGIGLPAHTKETFFFDQAFEKGIDWYAAHFRPGEAGRCLGEVAPTYFESRHASERLCAAFPELKIIITVRNPVVRTYSLLLHEFAKGRIGADLRRALVERPRILTSGQYAKHAPRWETTFGAPNVSYVFQEDIQREPVSVFLDICRHLNIPPCSLPTRLQTRYGERMVPRFRLLARLATVAASSLRQAGLHRVVQMCKRLGLKQVYRGGDVRCIALGQLLFTELLQAHTEDIDFIERRLGRTFPHWRDYDSTVEELRLLQNEQPNQTEPTQFPR